MRDFCWKQIGVRGDRSCPELQEFGHCRDCPVFSREGRTLLDREAPENYLIEWATLLAQERKPVCREGEVVQVFRLTSEWFALPAHCWVEVVGARPVRRIPHRSNPILMGLVSVRGEIHLCVSLSNMLGLENDEGLEHAKTREGNSRFCVVKKDNIGWVFPADAVHGLIFYSAKDVRNVPSTVAKSYRKFTCGLLDIEDKKVGLLDEIPVFDAFSRSVL